MVHLLLNNVLKYQSESDDEKSEASNPSSDSSEYDFMKKVYYKSI